MSILHAGDHTVELFHGLAPQCKDFETELVSAGLPLPLTHRTVWAQAHPSQRFWFLGVRNALGAPIYGCAIEVGPSRALPAHFILRIDRFGPAVHKEGRAAALSGLAHHARGESRLVRLHLEVFSRDPLVREHISALAMALGFRRRKHPRSYTETIAINLQPPESEILTSFHSTARRHVRAVEKNPVELRPIENADYAQRITELVQETMVRTGGQTHGYNWKAIIDLSKQHRELSKVTGLYRIDTDGPQALLAFAWARFHGDHADYAAAASTRKTDLKMAFGYALAWDLMRWAKQQGATWFDFGGITPGRYGEGDPVGGISDFKRYFGGEVISVGEEWVLEPQPVKAKIANTVSAGAAWVRSLFDSRS